MKYAKCWDFFVEKFDEDTNKMYDCCLVNENGKTCNKSFVHSGATTRMNEHLKRVHGFSNVTYTEKRKSKNESVSVLLVYFIISAALPFRIVENKFFKDFLNALNPQYKVPSRDEIRSLINELYDEKFEKLSDILSKQDKVSITIDSWTSKFQRESFLGFSCH